MRISVAQIAIYCAAGAEGEADHLPPDNLPTPAACGCSLLALELCTLMLCECGSRLPPRQQGQIEATGFDNAGKEIRFPPPWSTLTQAGWKFVFHLLILFHIGFLGFCFWKKSLSHTFLGLIPYCLKSIHQLHDPLAQLPQPRPRPLATPPPRLII